MTQKKSRQKNLGEIVKFGIFSAILLALVAVIVVNFPAIRDLMAGMGYAPSSEMSEIRESLALTGKGVRVFNAVRPELMEKEMFNQNCRELTNESAILGCYRDERIFIYNIVDDELPGIRELTTAHELLHAVYHRMSDGEKAHLGELLERVYEENKEVLGGEIELYPEEQKAEELYVRAGTEVKDLPAELEAHYAEIFENQDKIVEFYKGYITVFWEIEKKMDELLVRINQMNDDINARIAAYEAETAALNTEVSEFNNCAKTPDCFASDWVFESRRAELMGKQDALGEVYEQINALITEHNELVAEYNENVLHGQTLNNAINSVSNP